MDDLRLQAGENTIRAVASHLGGTLGTASITVTSQAIPAILDVRASPASGAATLDVEFRYSFNSARGVENVSVDFDGDGSDDFSTADPATVISHRYTTPGLYFVTLTLADVEGSVHTGQVAVAVEDPASIDALLKGMWNDMNSALTAGDKSTALAFLTARAREKYGPIWDVILPSMPAIVASFGPLKRVSASGELAEYGLTRVIRGKGHVFLIYFLQDSDGVWRLDSM